MTGNAPIDEYVFWKSIIEEKQETGESVPEILYELLELAQKKTLYYLMEKFSINACVNSDADVKQSSLH